MMKKTYISPELLAIECRCKSHMLQGSIHTDSNYTITNETDGSWTKEENNTISDKNLWDEEW